MMMDVTRLKVGGDFIFLKRYFLYTGKRRHTSKIQQQPLLKKRRQLTKPRYHNIEGTLWNTHGGLMPVTKLCLGGSQCLSDDMQPRQMKRLANVTVSRINLPFPKTM